MLKTEVHHSEAQLTKHYFRCHYFHCFFLIPVPVSLVRKFLSAKVFLILFLLKIDKYRYSNPGSGSGSKIEPKFWIKMPV